MDLVSVELQPQNKLGANTTSQGISDSKTDLSIDKKDSPSLIPVSVSLVQTISTQTSNVLGRLLEEWRVAKERMVLVKDGVAKLKKNRFLSLTLSVENELKKLFQAFDNLKRFDHQISVIGENVSKQSVDSMLDAFSQGTEAIKQSRQEIQQFVWLGSFRDKLLKYIFRVCLALFLFLLWMLMSTVSVFVAVVLGIAVTVGFLLWVLKPVKLPQLVETEGKEVLETMRLLEISLVSILAILRCLAINQL